MHRELAAPVLVTTIARVPCAVPVRYVVETLRPLPTESATCVHRGQQVRMIEGAALMSEVEDSAKNTTALRVVVLRDGDERIALLVDDVINVRSVRADQLRKPAFAAVDPALGASVAALLAEVRVLELEHEEPR